MSDVTVDGRITKAPCGGERTGKSPVGQGKQGLKRSTVVDDSGILLGAIAAPANRHDSPLLDETLDALEVLGPLPEQMSVHLDWGYDSVEKAWAEGRAMTLGEAVAYALSEAGATERQRP